jgi:hypothetical protein
MEHGTLVCVVKLTPFNWGQPLVIHSTITIYTVLYMALHITVTILVPDEIPSGGREFQTLQLTDYNER